MRNRLGFFKTFQSVTAAVGGAAKKCRLVIVDRIRRVTNVAISTAGTALRQAGEAMNATVIVLIVGAILLGTYGWYIKPLNVSPPPPPEINFGLDLGDLTVPVGDLNINLLLLGPRLPGQTEGDVNGGWSSSEELEATISGAGLAKIGTKWDLRVYVSRDLQLEINNKDRTARTPDEAGLRVENDPMAMYSPYDRGYLIKPTRPIDTLIVILRPSKDGALLSKAESSYSFAFPNIGVRANMPDNERSLGRLIITDEFEPQGSTDIVIDAGPQPATHLNKYGRESWAWEPLTRELGSGENGVLPRTIPSAHSLSEERQEHANEFTSGVLLGVAGAAAIGAVQEFVNGFWKVRRRHARCRLDQGERANIDADS